MRIKDYIKRLFEENNKKLISNINTSIDTKIEESVPNIENVAAFTPIGTIIAVMGNEAPENYLVCDGAIYNITDYQELAEYFETQFGSKNKFGGDGTTTFAVPDLRGEFLRGTGTNSYTNQGSGANVGIHQDATCIPQVGLDQTKGKLQIRFFDNTQFRNAVYPSDSWVADRTAVMDYMGSVNTNITSAEGLVTSRPTNTSVLYCIATKNIYLGATNNLVSSKNYYSEQEQIIGIWTDGKPLYQKTVEGITVPTTTADSTPQTEIVYDATSLNIDRVVDLRGMVRSQSNGNAAALNLPEYGNDNKLNVIDLFWVGSSNSVAIQNSILRYSGREVVFTMQYTKTTDTAGSATTTPGAYDINFPNMWPENTEVYFGNGLYGYRKTGTITASANERVWTSVIVLPVGTSPNIINAGGWIKWGDEGTDDFKYPINTAITGLTGWGSNSGAWSVMRTANQSIALWNTSGLPRTNAPYYVWVTYIKE